MLASLLRIILLTATLKILERGLDKGPIIQYNPYYQSLLDKDYKFIQSKKGIQLRINRSIQIEGAFGTVKGNYEYRRVRHKGKESVEKELLFMAFGFDLRKYRSRRDTDRLQQHYLEKEETHTVAC